MRPAYMSPVAFLAATTAGLICGLADEDVGSDEGARGAGGLGREVEVLGRPVSERSGAEVLRKPSGRGAAEVGRGGEVGALR